MPYIDLPRNGTALHYREYGEGAPLLFLHGGWGYPMYSFDAQIAALRDRFRILIPDRTGYGRSPHLESFVPGFHELAAEEMRQFLAALNIEQCSLWGHSDGAVTAVRMAIAKPERFHSIVVEAIHYDRRKPSSRRFFETAASDPARFGAGVAAAMAAEHGEDYWQQLMTTHGKAWLDILDTSADPARDLYSGRIGELKVPTLLIHGSADPRTEPDELKQLATANPTVNMHVIEGATHSPHSEPASESEVTRVARSYLCKYSPR